MNITKTKYCKNFFPRYHRIYITIINKILYLPFDMFYAIIFEPASPNPIAINAPIFNIVFSKIYISETFFFNIYVQFFYYTYFIISIIFQ